MATISHQGDVSIGEYGARDGPRTTTWHRAAWGAILMGAVTAIACQFVFTVLGIALGLTAADAADVGNAAADRGDAASIGMGAGAWWLITGTISLLIGGMVLGRVAGIARGTDLHLRALALWGVVAIFGFFVVWSGMMSAATSPLAGLSVQANAGSVRTAQVLGAEGQPEAAGTNPVAVEQATDSAKTASWWTLVGLGAGIAATLGGAWMAAGHRRGRVVNTRTGLAAA